MLKQVQHDGSTICMNEMIFLLRRDDKKQNPNQGDDEISSETRLGKIKLLFSNHHLQHSFNPLFCQCDVFSSLMTMRKIIILLLVSVFLNVSGNAQTRLIYGFVKDSVTLYPIEAKVTNVTKKRSVTTDANGFFKLDAAANDFIFISAPNFTYDTLNYSLFFTDTITLLLSPAGTILPNVTVTTRFNKYQLDSIQRMTEFQQDRGTTYNTVESNHGPGFGMTINLDRFKKKYRDKKRDEKVFNILEKSAYVDYRFSPQIAALYTGLKGEKLQAFIIKNKPTYQWLRLHPTNEDVLYYINQKLKESKH